jgi:acyl-CoA synthetase (AMP-forming)/AMP-acid ligase II
MMARSDENLVSLIRRRAADLGNSQAFTFLRADGGIAAEYGYAALDRDARALAAVLATYCRPGDRALIALSTGRDYITAFIGCLYGGIIAVPAFAPSPRSAARLRAIMRDSIPRVVLTNHALSARSRALLEQASRSNPVDLIEVDRIDEREAGSWQPVAIAPQSIALLQYTSGSTAEPKGAVITHANLISNQSMIAAAASHDQSTRLLGWLPLHHDMGLVSNIVHPLYLGVSVILMSPIDVLQSPLRWLEAVSRWHATTSGGPNFIYDLCARRTTPEQRRALDLGCWDVAFVGAEPIRPETLDRFSRAFAPCGFRPDAFLPCYGLAEATVFVTGRSKGTGCAVLRVGPDALEREGRVRPTVSGRCFISCGCVRGDLDLRIVDPASGIECATEQVGEIWIAGASVAAGYWKKEETTRESFGAELQGVRGQYLRTGDLGFLSNGELYIAGRLKDLIKIRGRNCYPQDIERAVENGCPEIRPGCCAAFSIEVDGEEKIVVVAELERGFAGSPMAVVAKMRCTISTELELASEGILLVKPAVLPKTSSGKIQRRLCRAMLLDRQFAPLAESWIGFRDRRDDLAPREAAGASEEG